MIKRALKLLIAPLLVFNFVVTVVQPGLALAQASSSSVDAACEGVEAAGGNCDPTDAKSSFNEIIATVINIFSLVVGALSVVMIIIGGFRYVVSGGDSNGISGAKNTIIYAVVGLVVVLFSQVIVRFVISQTS